VSRVDASLGGAVLEAVAEDTDRLDFLSGGGEMGALMRAHDWSNSSLGHPRTWPQPLRTALRLLLNTGHPMYIWWGADLACLYNDAYRRSIGAERHPGSLGMPGRQVWDEIWDIIGPQIEQVMAGRGATWNVDHLVPITRDGRLEDVYWTYSYSPIDDSSAPSGVGGVLVVCTETTEKVLAEQRLQAQVERQRRLFEQAPGFIAVLRGPEHVFEFVNLAYKQITGNRDYIGRTVREVLPDVEGQGFFELLDKVYTTGERFIARQTPLRLTPSPEGPSEERFLDFIYEPVIGESGEITGIFVEGHDVTEQKRAEAALRESEERFRIAQELSLDAFTILQALRDDTGSIIDFEWLYANPAAGRLLQHPPEALIGRRLLDVHPGDRAQSELFEQYVRLVETGEAHDIELRYEADGVSGWFRNMAVRLDDRIAVYFSDITERKHSEEKLKLLMREVDHRAKNMLALVQALIRMTRAETVPQFVAALKGRIEALGRVQTLLTDSRWRGADLGQLIRDELAPYQFGERIRSAGPTLMLPPATAQVMVLVLHELTTNAVKYGALAVPQGRLAVEWHLSDSLALQWIEEGGPVSAPPQRRGFGTTVIENSIAQQLGGTVLFDWRPAGLACEIKVPAEQLTENEDPIRIASDQE
jgi:PAS domain S-box-containing protein